MTRVVGLTLIVLCCGLPTPASEVQAAASDLAHVRPGDRAFTRYLTSYAVDPEIDAAAVGSFWCNSLSRARRLTRPTRITATLWRIDLRDYHWSADAWERIGRRDPWLRHWLDLPSMQPMASETKSARAVLRLDYFVRRSSLHEHYRDFVGLGQSIEETQQSYRVRIADAQALRLDLMGSVAKSKVALHNRRLVRYPTLSGYWWQSDDHLGSDGRKNVLDFLTDSDVDAHEYIWSLPNGMQAYAISGADGQLIDVVPADIAQDYHTALQDRQIRSPQSCVGCHGRGINAVEDVVRELARRLEIRSYDRETAERIEELFLGPLDETIEADCAQYAAAVRAACGLEPEEAARLYDRMLYNYLDRPIDREIAARELGVDVDELERAAVPYGDAAAPSGTLAAILIGQPVSRQAWGSIYTQAALTIEANRGRTRETRTLATQPAD